MGKRGKKEGHHWGTQTPQTKVCAFKHKKREDTERENNWGERVWSLKHILNPHILQRILNQTKQILNKTQLKTKHLLNLHTNTF